MCDYGRDRHGTSEIGSAMSYRYITLSEIAKYEPEMKRLGVSVVARSPRGFLTYYKKIGGDAQKVNEEWRKKRNAFIARHLAQYRAKPTYRRFLALVAWAYKPQLD